MEVGMLASSPLTLNALKRQRSAQFSLKKWNSNKSFSRKGKYEDNVVKHDARYSDSVGPGLCGERLSLAPEKKSKRLLPGNCALSASLIYYAHNSLFSKALGIWDEMMNSSFVPDAQVVSQLIFIYGSNKDFNMVNMILHQMLLKDVEILADIFSLAISFFGKTGQLDCMELMIKNMVSMGYPVGSATGNAYILYYSVFGSLADMEVAYGRLKRSRILIEEEAIRAVAFAYIKENRFYALARFVHDVGLGRRNVGNLLWNLLLLSYAANFKMKSLQREFVRMVETGFRPDLNTFNIRSLAFSRMSLIWDLHLSLDHMKHEGVAPDLVTYGCVVDAYLDRRLGRNLHFALSKLDWGDSVSILTDPLVFEAIGKGDFHLNSDSVMEYGKKKDWTYKRLVSIYLKKKNSEQSSLLELLMKVISTATIIWSKYIPTVFLFPRLKYLRTLRNFYCYIVHLPYRALENHVPDGQGLFMCFKSSVPFFIFFHFVFNSEDPLQVEYEKWKDWNSV